MFRDLPKKAEHVKSGVVNVNLEDVESVTSTLVKSKGSIWNFQMKKGADEQDENKASGLSNSDSMQRKLAEEDFTAKYSDWKADDWNELDWDKVKDLRVRELLAERRMMAQIAQQAHCLNCPQFLEHVSCWKTCLQAMTMMATTLTFRPVQHAT